MNTINLLNKKSFVSSKLSEGVYNFTIKSTKEVKNDNGGYVEVIFVTHTKDKNIEKEIKYLIFNNEKQIEYLISAMGAQQNISDAEVSLGDLLIPGMRYKVFVSYSDVNTKEGLRNKPNYSFNPKEETEEDEQNLEEVL